eukprot:TRINITY_DN18703_c0_g3_i1.p1 TRINITY_DN18703_c0_g3~~TRINITY_DN18703_c0_g3_i1.p1  ORF type:complete len:270 (-),score=43.79 TRINITY_DN18703_c0_g3_i1:20-829(-)
MRWTSWDDGAFNEWGQAAQWRQYEKSQTADERDWKKQPQQKNYWYSKDQASWRKQGWTEAAPYASGWSSPQWPAGSQASAQHGPAASSAAGGAWRRPQGDVAKRRVHIVGDSMLRGMQRIFRTEYGCSKWLVDNFDGAEPLGVDLEAEKMQEFDHVVFCTAGNGMWPKGKQRKWEPVERNIQSFDPRHVSVIFLGSAECWTRICGCEPKNPKFFENARWELEKRGIQVVQLSDEFMGSLEYADTEGHPSKQARSALAEKIVETVRELLQ